MLIGADRKDNVSLLLLLILIESYPFVTSVCQVSWVNTKPQPINCHGISFRFLVPSDQMSLCCGWPRMTSTLLYLLSIRTSLRNQGISFCFLVPWQPRNSLAYLAFKNESRCRSWLSLGCFSNVLTIIDSKESNSGATSPFKARWKAMSESFCEGCNKWIGICEISLDLWRWSEKHILLLAMSCHGRYVYREYPFTVFLSNIKSIFYKGIVKHDTPRYTIH